METVEQQLASVYNRATLPAEYGNKTNNSTTNILVKLFDQIYAQPDIEKEFITTDPVVLRNTAINSLIGRDDITEEKIQALMKSQNEKERTLLITWKVQQAINYLKNGYN